MSSLGSRGDICDICDIRAWRCCRGAGAIRDRRLGNEPRRPVGVAALASPIPMHRVRRPCIASSPTSQSTCGKHRLPRVRSRWVPCCVWNRQGNWHGSGSRWMRRRSAPAGSVAPPRRISSVGIGTNWGRDWLRWGTKQTRSRQAMICSPTNKGEWAANLRG